MADTDTLNALQTANRSSSVLNAIANPAQVNPLAAMSAGVSAARNVYDLRQQQATEAAGQAYQGAINQDTGEFDPNRFRTLLSQSGPAAMAAGTALANTQQISSDQLNQVLKKAQWVNSRAGAQLLSGDFSDTGMLRIFQEGLAAGTLTMPEVQKQMQLLPPDAAGRQRWLEEHRDTAGSYAEQVQQKYGTRQPVSTGSGTAFPVIPSARTGGPTPVVPSTMTPAELDAPGAITLQDTRKTLPDGSPNPNFGNKQPYTRREVMTGQGYTFGPNNEIIPPGHTLGPDGKLVPSGQPSSLGSGRYPNLPPALEGKPPPVPVEGKPPPAPVVPGSNRPISEASPGEKVSMEASGPAFQRETDAGTQAQTQQATLGNMLADTAQFVTGPQAGIVGKMRNWGIALGIPGINVEGQSAKESFGKLAAGLANAQGAGSDARMAVNIQANPHEELSPAGVDLVIRQLQGNADYLQARAKLAQAWPGSKSDYSGFTSSISQLDPRVFQYERMQPDQRKAWFTALGTKDQKAFMTSHGWAENKGLIGGG